MIFIVLLVVAAAFAATTAELASAEISYTDVLIVRNSGDGYEYGNNGTFIYKDTLQDIVDEVTLSGVGTAVLSFDQVTAHDVVAINGTTTFVFTGEISCESVDALFTISTGARLQALTAQTCGAVVWVQSGGSAEIAGGVLTTTSPSFNATVINSGICTINDATLYYKTATPEISGFVVYQSGQSASLSVTGGYLDGNSVLAMESGAFAVSGGTLRAVQSQQYNSENGYTLRVSNNAHGVLSGGSLYSVDPTRCVVLRGGVGSYFDWQGGSLSGQILLTTGSPSMRTTLTVSGKTIGASQLAEVYLAATEGALTLDSAVLGVYPTAGNYLVGWSDDVQEEHPSLDAFESDFILPVLSNMHTVGLQLADQQSSAYLAYGASLDPFEYGITLPQGYEVVYWMDGDGEYVVVPYTVQKNTTLTATLRIADFSLAVSEDIDIVYDGVQRSLAGTWTAEQGLTYVCSWVREGVGEISDDSALPIVSVVDSGRYQLTVTATDGTLSTSIASRWIQVDIAKADYQDVEHEAFAGTYDPDRALSAFVL
ncbi:MAG: hypothetical protein J5755_00665, partial [Clostridia bacterium]|nr:hypothetical protein [Clostridia bacterium]